MNADRMAMVEELCRSYVAAMESSDLEALLANFTNCATATSPISGKQSVRDFYSYVMRVTSGRSMELKTVFVGASEPLRVAIHIAYTRTVGDGKPATVEASTSSSLPRTPISLPKLRSSMTPHRCVPILMSG